MEAAKASEIRQQATSAVAARNLLTAFQGHRDHVLLFLKSVRKVSCLVRPAGSEQPQLLYSAELSTQVRFQGSYLNLHDPGVIDSIKGRCVHGPHSSLWPRNAMQQSCSYVRQLGWASWYLPQLRALPSAQGQYSHLPFQAQICRVLKRYAGLACVVVCTLRCAGQPGPEPWTPGFALPHPCHALACTVGGQSGTPNT